MSLEAKIYAHLSTCATIISQVGTAIFLDAAIVGATTPLLVYHRISGVRLHSLSGYTQQENARVQFNVYATSASQRITAMTGLLNALYAATAFHAIALDSPADEYDDELAMYVRRIDVSIWHKED